MRLRNVSLTGTEFAYHKLRKFIFHDNPKHCQPNWLPTHYLMHLKTCYSKHQKHWYIILVNRNVLY